MRTRKVKEAAGAYVASKTEMPKTTISSKYQITLPARLVRELGLQPGDKLEVELKGLSLILHPRPKDWVAYTAGSMPGYYGKTKEEIDTYLREVRGSWERMTTKMRRSHPARVSPGTPPLLRHERGHLPSPPRRAVFQGRWAPLRRGARRD